MKELSIEEKAKAYDKAIEKAKAYHNDYTNDIMEEIFPELKESEDERIRKELIKFVKVNIPNEERYIAWLEKQGQEPRKVSIWKHWKDGLAGNGSDEPVFLIKRGNMYNLSSCLSYECDYIKLSELNNLMLEKQGEQKHVVIISKFRIGDEIKTSDEESLTITKIDDKGYWSENLFICNFDDVDKWELVEQKPADKVEPKFHEGDWAVSNLDGKARQISEVHFDKYNSYYVVDGKAVNLEEYDRLHHLWTIDNAKDGDVLSDRTTIFIFKDLLSEGCSVMSYCDYDTDSGESDAFCPLSVNLRCSKITPATKEQREQLEKAMADARYTFDFEKKELKKIEPKFKKGDQVVISTSEGERIVKIDSVDYFKSGEPMYITTEGRWFGNGTKARLKDVKIEQKPILGEEDKERTN